MINKAKLVAVTKPYIDEVETAEQFIAYCARVSNPSNQNNTKTASRLVEYLIANKHWSPFEMVSVTMEIETTRDISRQLLRHRSFSFQEFSQRYADPTDHLSFVSREMRLQDQKNRQNSVEVTQNPDDVIQIQWERDQEKIKDYAKNAYAWAIHNGIAKEQARALLPEGLIATRLYVSGTLRSWIHYCDLRMGNGTQKEHRILATMCWNEICKHFPSVAEAISNIKALEELSKGI